MYVVFGEFVSGNMSADTQHIPSEAARMRSVVASELLKGLLNDPKLLNQRLCKMSQPRLQIEKKVTHRLLILFYPPPRQGCIIHVRLFGAGLIMTGRS